MSTHLSKLQFKLKQIREDKLEKLISLNFLEFVPRDVFHCIIYFLEFKYYHLTLVSIFII